MLEQGFSLSAPRLTTPTDIFVVSRDSEQPEIQLRIATIGLHTTGVTECSRMRIDMQVPETA